uniref:Secreted protein n=1 Tax=Ascaris lumbricoides TaxID=6252 RepID=A0A0M3I5J4_ASCLU
MRLSFMLVRTLQMMGKCIRLIAAPVTFNLNAPIYIVIIAAVRARDDTLVNDQRIQDAVNSDRMEEHGAENSGLVRFFAIAFDRNGWYDNGSEPGVRIPACGLLFATVVVTCFYRRAPTVRCPSSLLSLELRKRSSGYKSSLLAC